MRIIVGGSQRVKTTEQAKRQTISKKDKRFQGQITQNLCNFTKK